MLKLIALFSGKPKLVFVSSKCFIFVVNVISPANDEIPATSNLFTLNPTVFIPTVVIPAEIGVTSIGVVKLKVPAVPTVLPSSLITTPVPDATTPVNPEPSPKYFVAVTKPAIFTLSKFVCPSTSKSPFISAVPPLPTNKLPTNCDAVATPALPS